MRGLYLFAGVAQLAAQLICNQWVGGSSPLTSYIIKRSDCMKIPKSFKIIGLFFGILMVISFYSFYNAFYFVGPLVHLLICIASVGLFLTVLVACIEWKRGKYDNKKHDREVDRKRKREKL